MLKTKKSRSITYWLVILALYVVSAAVHAHGYDNFFEEFVRFFTALVAVSIIAAAVLGVSFAAMEWISRGSDE